MNWQDNKPDFERLMKLYGSDVYRMSVLRLQDAEEAKDVFQTVFMRLYCCNKDFESDDHIRRWLLKVTVNECINIHKSAWKRHVMSASGSTADRIDAADTTYGNPCSEYNNYSNDRTGIWDAVSSLPPKYRDVIFLYYYEELSTAEIAGILGIMQTGVRSRLKRARDILKKEADNYEF